jgi:putative membrane protein
MIANSTNHTANERTFLAWICTGLVVSAFGFFLIKLNVFVDAAVGGAKSHPPAEGGGAMVAAATCYAGPAMVAMGAARAETLLSAGLAVATLIICINLART